jgi:dihydrofolate reductase
VVPTALPEEIMMRKIIAALYLSLDGVMEELSWTMPYWNDELAKAQHDLMFSSGALLLGRITYQGFAQAWPTMQDEDGGANRMNSLPKHVATTTLNELEWNASAIEGDVVQNIRTLKEAPGQNLLIYGSGALVRSLLPHNLIDEYRLMIFPLVLGRGQRLFTDGSEAKLRLDHCVTTSTGVVILTYTPQRG